jgi:hypothetical protein
LSIVKCQGKRHPKSTGWHCIIQQAQINRNVQIARFGHAPLIFGVPRRK